MPSDRAINELGGGGKLSRAVALEIEHRSTKEQIEKNIRKNLEYSDVVYEIASDEAAKKKRKK